MVACAVVAFSQIGSQESTSRKKTCNRACLNGFLDQYLAALTSHDPTRVPITTGVKFTENTVHLKIGEGAWKTATEIGSYRIRIADPRAGQAVFFGVLKEGSKAAMFALRIKVESQQITEVETILVSPKPGTPFAVAIPNLKTARPAFAEALTVSERVSREKMIAATNAYYEGIEHGTGKIVPFAKDCHRIENGVALVNNPNYNYGFVSPSGRTLPNFAAMGCREQFDTGIWATDTITDRRFPVVDEERGVVAAFTIYNGHAAKRCADTPAYGPVCPGSNFKPNSLDLLELMKIRNGEIHEQESIWERMSAGIKSGW